MTNIYSNPNDWYEAHGNVDFRSEAGIAVFHETFEKAEGLVNDEFRETVIDYFFELKDFLEKTNRWDDYIALRDNIIKYQLAFYEQESAYIEPDLAAYFLFHKDTVRATESLKLISDFVFSDVDMNLGIHGLAAAYGKTDWIIGFADQHYTAFYDKKREYMGYIHLEIDLFAFFATAENLYVASKTTGIFDATLLVERAQRMALPIKDIAEHISALMQEDAVGGEAFKTLYVNENISDIALNLAFCKYMYDEKGVSFTATYLIIDILTDFENEADTFNFDAFDAAEFKDYAEHLGGFMNNCEYKPILAPLGAIYKCDFLKKCGLITQNQYDAVVAPCIVFVDFFAHQWHWRLKDNGYLRDWQKPDSLTQADFDTLLATIAKAYEPESDDTNRGRAIENLRVNNLMESWATPKMSKPQYTPPSYTPIKAEPKIGRNDTCTCGSGKKYKKCCGK